MNQRPSPEGHKRWGCSPLAHKLKDTSLEKNISKIPFHGTDREFSYLLLKGKVEEIPSHGPVHLWTCVHGPITNDVPLCAHTCGNWPCARVTDEARHFHFIRGHAHGGREACTTSLRIWGPGKAKDLMVCERLRVGAMAPWGPSEIQFTGDFHVPSLGKEAHTAAFLSVFR